MITKEQEEELYARIEKNKKEGEYVCNECLKRFIGINAVHRHIREKKHYGFKSPGGGNLGFV